MVNSDAQTSNGDIAVSAPQPIDRPIDYIELDDEDEVIIEEPPAKKAKSEKEASAEPANGSARNSPPADSTTSAKKEENKVDNYTVLLDQLQEHVDKILTLNDLPDRKLLDTLLGAINLQVQKEPYAVRKLILEKQLVLPNSISFPPSQVVDAVIEHDADVQISKVLNNMFADERIKLNEAEKRERQHFKNTFPAPAMTRMLVEIGQDLVQESTYSDIVHARNLPETPKNLDTYKQVAAQLKPVWENLRDRNSSFKLKTYTCGACGFKTENVLLMSVHKQQIHFAENKKFQCGMCPEYNTSGTRMHRHYIEKHALAPLIPEDPPAKIQCSLCEQDFPFKGQRDAHFKQCRRDATRLARIQEAKMPEHSAFINRWLWAKPPADPIIQQDLKKQQEAKIQQQQRALAQNIAAPRLAPVSQQTQLKTPAIKNQPPSLKPQQSSSATSSTISAMLANQQFQQQLKNLDPAQQKQLHQLLQTKQAQIPTHVMNAIQAQLSALKPPPPQPAQQSPQINTASLIKTLSQIGGLANLNGKLNPQLLQQIKQTIQAQQAAASGSSGRSGTSNPQRKIGGTLPGSTSSAMSNRSSLPASKDDIMCEICDRTLPTKREYITHLHGEHNLLRGRLDPDAGPPLACSRCRERFWSYEGLERHLVMNHNLVTSDLLHKAQNKVDGGRCKHCKKSFAFNILQHLASDHQAKLCSAEIMFSCDVCTFKCSSYAKLEVHLTESHPKNGTSASKSNGIR
ncbi:Mep-1 [Aphelenchoides bicaudatus]|nr:Mep-1 [Aphelenchoides bicaudatus]